jgi:hypothetical protein
MSRSRVLVASHYNATRYVYDTHCYETVWGFAGCDDADVLAPSPPNSPRQLRIDKAKRRIKSLTGLGTSYRIEPVEVEKDYELFVYVATVLTDLPDIARIRHWRRRANKAACVVLKAYGTELQQFERCLTVLNAFDMVYSGSLASIPLFQSMISPPVRYLAYGIPALETMPAPIERERTIDVYAMGRRFPTMHDQMVRAMISGSINYVFDSFDNSVPFIKDFAGHCLSKRQLFKQTRFFPNFGIRSFHSREIELAGEEDSITPPTSLDYPELFDWEDVIIPAPVGDFDYLGFLRSLDGQTERMRSIRRRNVYMSLLKHDLAYRFEEILKDLQLDPHEKLKERKRRLALAAARFAPTIQYNTIG